MYTKHSSCDSSNCVTETHHAMHTSFLFSSFFFHLFVMIVRKQGTDFMVRQNVERRLSEIIIFCTEMK